MEGLFSVKNQKNKKAKKRVWKKFVYTNAFDYIGNIGDIFCWCCMAFSYILWGGLNRKQLDESKLSVNAGLAQESGKITNIALYGSDSRNHDYKGLSDVIMIASINSKTNNVKLISIARDTYVDVPGYGKTKITHAYSYGGARIGNTNIE